MNNSQKIKILQDCKYNRKRFMTGLSIYLILLVLKWTYIVWANENIVEFERFSIWTFIDSLVTFFSLILLILIIYLFICAYKWFLQIKRTNLYVYGTAVMETAYKVGFRRYIFVVSFCDKDGNIKKQEQIKYSHLTGQWI